MLGAVVFDSNLIGSAFIDGDGVRLIVLVDCFVEKALGRYTISFHRDLFSDDKNIGFTKSVSFHYPDRT